MRQRRGVCVCVFCVNDQVTCINCSVKLFGGSLKAAILKHHHHNLQECRGKKSSALCLGQAPTTSTPTLQRSVVIIVVA